MTPEFNARSFDRPRERPAPERLRGHWSLGDDETITLREVTLVVAIKSHCVGCREFINADLDELGVPVLVISAEVDESDEWRDARHPVFVSPDAFQLLEIRSAPFYVLIDPVAQKVLSEGVLFGPAQVAAELAPYLRA